MARPKNEKKEEVQPKEQVEETTVQELNEVAFGLVKRGNKYELVTIKFNADTKESVIEKVENAGDRREAVNKFKLAIFNAKLLTR